MSIQYKKHGTADAVYRTSSHQVKLLLVYVICAPSHLLCVHETAASWNYHHYCLLHHSSDCCRPEVAGDNSHPVKGDGFDIVDLIPAPILNRLGAIKNYSFWYGGDGIYAAHSTLYKLLVDFCWLVMCYISLSRRTGQPHKLQNMNGCTRHCKLRLEKISINTISSSSIS